MSETKTGEPKPISLFEIPERTFADLSLLMEPAERSRYSLFLKTVSGEVTPKRLPPAFRQPSFLTARFLQMRAFSQAHDTERADGIYFNPKSGWFILEEPVMGEYNPIEKCYEAGILPKIPGFELTVKIHSHPSHQREQKIIGDQLEEKLFADNLPSEPDVGLLLTLSKLNRNLDTAASSIVVGRDLAVLICRTKQTPSKQTLVRRATFGPAFIPYRQTLRKRS